MGIPRSMKWINYNHLYYFWMVAREGGVARASDELMVSQPTVSVQVKELERAVGHKLFDRVGRTLQLTEAGRVAFNYANEMFLLGQEMANALEHQPATRPLRLAVGVLDHYFFNIEFSHMVALFWGCIGLGYVIAALAEEEA